MTNVFEVMEKLANSRDKISLAQRMGGMKTAYKSNPPIFQVLKDVEAIMYLSRQRKRNGIGNKTMHRR